MTLIPASDGLLARQVREWSHEKLFYVEHYLDIFCTSMKDKWSALVYADLLSGLGRCIYEESGEEGDGSPLLAVSRPEFRRLFLNDFDSAAAAALAVRTSSEPSGRIQITALDCNEAVDQAREFLFPRSTIAGTLGLAVIDPTAFQMRFDAVNRLTTGVRMDLIIIFMTDFIRRFGGTPPFERTMYEAYGTTDWRRIFEDRRQGEVVTYRKFSTSMNNS